MRLPAKSLAGFRDRWEPELTAFELAEVLRLERVIEEQRTQMLAVLADYRKAISTARKLRQKVINKGIGRARWKLLGRAEHMANRTNRLAAMKSRRQPQESTT